MGIFSGEFYSSDLQKTTSLRVIFPDSSNDVTPIVEGEPRVLYLLHGLSGNSAEWSRFSKIEYYAKKYNFIISCRKLTAAFTAIQSAVPAISPMWQMNCPFCAPAGSI